MRARRKERQRCSANAGDIAGGQNFAAAIEQLHGAVAGARILGSEVDDDGAQVTGVVAFGCVARAATGIGEVLAGDSLRQNQYLGH